VVDGAALEKRCAKAPRVRIPPSPPDVNRQRAGRRHVGRLHCSRRSSRSPRRGRLVDYGAALEMRFGATRRGFESRPLRQRSPGGRPMPALAPPLRSRTSGCARSGARTPPWPRPSSRRAGLVTSISASPIRSAIDSVGRARRGTSGALYLQTALAGLNSHPRSPFSRAAASSDVEDRVPRSGESRTVSGPEGSSTKRTSSGAAERPGPSRSLWWARKRSGRRWVHGNLLPPARDRTGAL
jgi:hypothetical protein